MKKYEEGYNMFKKIITAGCESFIKLLTSLKRFPEVILLASAMVIILIFLNHLGYSGNTALRERLVKIAMIIALGIPLYLIVKLLFERLPMLNRGLKIALYLGVIIGLFFYYYCGLKSLTMVPLTRYTAFSIAFYLIFLFIPYYYKRENFELYCVHLLTSLVITYFYASVLYLGISAIIFTIDKLFTFSLNGMVYFDVWLVVAGIFAPAYFMAEIPAIRTEFQIEDYPKVLKILFLYIIIPMLILYSVILYIYFAKIIITRSWPAGIVSQLVLWYGLITSVVFFCIYPLRSTVKWLNKLLSLFPKFLFPLIAMMFVAMGIRIHAYGITESRYFVLIAGLWTTGWMLYYLLAKKVRNIVLPISMAVLALLSVIGPWSAYSISKFDQNNRFTAILKKYAMIQGERLVKPNRPISAVEKAKIISILAYFKKSHSINNLKYLPDNFKLSQARKFFGFAINRDAFNNNDWQSYFNYEFANNQNDQLFNVRGFDYFINIQQTDIVKTNPTEKVRINYTLGAKELKVVFRDQEIYRKKVSDFVIPLFKKETVPGAKSITYLDENEQIKVFYIFNTVSGQKDSITDDINVNYLSFEVFIKLK
jgi:hypothetical protein